MAPPVGSEEATVPRPLLLSSLSEYLHTNLLVSESACQELGLGPEAPLVWKVEKLSSIPCFVTIVLCDLSQVPDSLWAFNCKMSRFAFKVSFNCLKCP